MIDSAPEPESVAVDAAEAWKAVGLVNEWVRHAETKAAATFTIAGVVGGVLYSLVKTQGHPRALLAVLAVVCAAAVLASGFCAVLALWPRLRAKDTPTSALYFDHIARRHPAGDTYVAELRRVVVDAGALLDQLAQQIWANAHVARRKYQWAGRALVGLVVAVAALAAIIIYLALVSAGVIDGR